MDDLYQQWLDAKSEERIASERRRQIEDLILASLRVDPKIEGTTKLETDCIKGTITTRHNRRVDGDKLQEIAAENGMTEHLSTLFRWKPDINMSAWKRADESITKTLSGAITTTAGRPSFKISFKIEIVEN